VQIRAICDDIHLVGDDAQVAGAFKFIRDELEKIGLILGYSDTKTCCWAAHFHEAPPMPLAPLDATQADRDALLATHAAAVLAAADARRACSALPATVVSLGGGVVSLGSFIGSDAFVQPPPSLRWHLHALSLCTSLQPPSRLCWAGGWCPASRGACSC
jgi:hypothetical protein